MVCISVIATGFVMHISVLSHPMPRWIKRLFLDIIPRFLCLSVYSDVDLVGERVLDKTHEDNNGVIVNGIELNDAAEDNGTSVGSAPKASSSEVADLLQFLKDDNKFKWRRLSIIIDRMLLYLFTLFAIVCTTYFGVGVFIKSAEEYDMIFQDLDDNWPYGVQLYL